MRRSLMVLSVAGVLAASCGSSEGGATTTAAASTAAPTTAMAVTTTAAATTTTAAPSTTATTTTTAAPATTTAAPTTTTSVALPETIIPTHGGDAVAVYLGIIAESDSSGNLNADFADVIAAAADLGYDAGVSDLGCDVGAREGLGLDDGYYYAVGLYFATVEDANGFAAAYPGDIVGIAEVQTLCLD